MRGLIGDFVGIAMGCGAWFRDSWDSDPLMEVEGLAGIGSTQAVEPI